MPEEHLKTALEKNENCMSEFMEKMCLIDDDSPYKVDVQTESNKEQLCLIFPKK